MAKQPNQKVLTKKHLARMEKERIQQRNLLIGTIAVLVLVALLIMYGVFDQNVLQKNRPVAQVGGAAITTGDFQTQVRYARLAKINTLQQFMSNQLYQQFFGQYIQQLQQQLSDPNTLAQQTLTQMIEDKVIAQYAAANGITVTDAEIDKQIQENFGYYVNGTPTPTMTPTIWPTPTLNSQQMTLVPPTETPTLTPTGPTPTATGPTPTQGTVTPTSAGTATPTPTETMTPTVTPTGPTPTATTGPTSTPGPTNTPYTQQGFQKNYDDYLTQLKSINFTAQDLRNLVKAQLLRDKVKEIITKDVKPVQEEVWARHILVATKEDADKARQRLMNGESFAKVAAEMSTDSSKDSGGDLGWFPKGKMVKPFEEAAFSLKVGEISQPVQSDFGYHIIQVLGKEDRPLSASDFDQAKTTAFQTWLDAQKKEKNVQQFDRWAQVIPTDPVVPAQLLQNLNQDPNQGVPLPSGPN